MYIGDRIRELRTEKGYSQVEMAERVHVSKQTWYKYENNIVTNIPYDKIEAIAQALNVTPAYLMGWDKSRLPVLGRVAAGVPTEMILDLSYPDAEYLESPDEYCTLEIHGAGNMQRGHRYRSQTGGRRKWRHHSRDHQWGRRHL